MASAGCQRLAHGEHRFQPRLEDEPLNAINGLPNVALHRDPVVLAAESTDASVVATVRHGDETFIVEARVAIAADGAGSSVRQALGIEREDLGFDSRWLVVDGRVGEDFPTRFRVGGIEVPASTRIVQICDPRRPVYLGPLRRGYRRFEWMLIPGETVEQFSRPETAWSLLAELGVVPEGFELFRNIVYAFEARLARRWRAGNIFLIGDAAHTMPPYLRQGMVSGIRDAKNLAWKLDLALRGTIPWSTLDSYQAERMMHTRHLITACVEVGCISCTIGEEEAQRRADLGPLAVPDTSELS